MAPTIQDLVSRCENDLADAQRREDKARAEIRAMLDMATDEGRRNLSQAETERSDKLFNDINGYEDDRKHCERRLAAARREMATEAEYETRVQDIRPAAQARKYDQVARVGREERTYRPDSDPHGQKFLSDVCRQFLFNDVESNERLSRHAREERVERPQYAQRVAGDATTVNWAGLTVPQYLTDMVAPATAALKPLIDNANQHSLPPDGMSLNISRVTTPSSAGNQASELATVSATSLDDTLLTVPVLTAAGSQNVSRQAIERGTGIEETTTMDLMRRVATSMDSQFVNAATNGLLAVGQTTVYTDASPTPQLLYPNIYKSESLLEQALLGVAVPDMVVMHSRRWNWFVSALGSTWPLIGGSNVASQSGGIVVSNEYGSGVRGILPNGLRVVVDNNLPTNLGAGTNQDPILVCASQELHVWQDPNAPVLIRAGQPNAASLGVLLVAYSYWAASPGTGLGRYVNNPGIINGTGTIAPAGF
jgi:hypothetical protein